MGIFKDQAAQISALWQNIYKACENNPQLSEPHLTGITYKDVGNAIVQIDTRVKYQGQNES